MRLQSNKLLITLCCFLLFVQSTQANSYHFEQYSLNEGLSQSTARVIYRDTIGMLWIGTKNGLNRYDGESIYNYFADERESSLPGNEIYCIAEDKSNRLWIGTNKGLCYYDPLSDSFVQSKYQEQPIVFHTLHLHDGELYSITQQSLWQFDDKTQAWERARIESSVNFGSRLKIISLDERTLLIGSRWHGIYCCNIQTKELTPLGYFANHMVSDMYQDREGSIWVSSYGKGLYSLQQNSAGEWDATFHLAIEKSMAIVEYNGAILVGTDGIGLINYTEKQKTDRPPTTADYNHNLPTKSIFTLYVDPYNTLWVGTIRAGALSMHSQYIRSYGKVDPGSNMGLSTSTVLSFYQEENLVWIGTDGEGINRFIPKSEHFTHYPNTFGYKISSITGYDKHHLLLSTYNAGFLLFNKQNGAIRTLPVANSSVDTLFTDYLGRHLYTTNQGKIYLYEDNLYQYDLITRQITPISKPKGVGGGRFHTPLFHTRELLLYDLQNIYLKHKDDTDEVITICSLPDSLDTEINMVDKDRYGNYWIATTKGLLRFTPSNGQFKYILPDQIPSVSTLLIDYRSSMWMGVGTSLYRYYIQNHKLYKYTKNEGAFPNEYLSNTRMVDSQGNLYIGGVNGFSLIERNTPFPEVQIPKVQFLNSLLDGQHLPISRITKQGEKITLLLPPNHTSLQLNLFINTPTLSTFPNCRYLLRGNRTEYQPLTNSKITLQRLLPGNYTLEIVYEQEDGQWSSPHIVVSIYVDTPWWRRWWFYTLLTVIMTAILLYIRHRHIRNTEEAMQLAQQKNEQALSEEKIRFLINVSHELRTPLTLVYAPMRRMLEDPTLTEALKATLSNMYKHVKNMKSIIDMVLDIRKMEIKNTPLNLEAVEVNSWLSEILQEFELEFNAKHIKIVKELDTTIGTLQFDKSRCHKVFSNLLMNAIKFTDESGIIKITALRQEEYIYFAVEDNGMGIAPTDIPHLFTRFYQTNHQKGGTGIGLSYARTQIQLHGGEIGYKPATERGSIFWFTLPIKSVQSMLTGNILHPTDAATEGVNMSEVPTNIEQTFNFLDFTAVVAEDEKDLREFLKEILAPLFKKVIAVKNGEEALFKIRQAEPDIVISDVMMPVMNGFELCKSIKSDINISHVPIILLTALSDNENSLMGYKMGADHYLAKPFEVELLCSVIKNIFEARRAIREQNKLLQLPLDTAKITFSNADERFLERLINLIEEHLDDTEINIDFFASEMAMSRSSFYQKIKVVTGKSANVFIQEYKIGRAMQLLTTTDAAVVDIAAQVGFSNQRYFSTVFKQTTGKTPSEYRQNRDRQDKNRVD